MKRKVELNNLVGFLRSSKGLEAEEVSSQRTKFGKNEIIETNTHPIREMLSDTVRDPMLWFLLVISLIFFLTGESSDAVVLLAAILPLMLMDAFLHWRTQSSTASLKGTLAGQSMVLREGKKILLKVEEIVPGDRVLITSNDYLPADGIFVETTHLQIDESALTGEALPIQKKAWEPSENVQAEEFFEEDYLGFAGTRVLSGEGVLFVSATGERTEYSLIVKTAIMVTHERTPLQLAIMELVKKLLTGSAIFCLLLALVRIVQGKGIIDAFLSAATLAIAAIPEEFPIVFTFYLGIGVFRLAKKHVLVRKAVSVENIGRVGLICTDKTGTVTLGEFRLVHLIPAQNMTSDQLLRCALDASSPSGSDPLDSAISEKATEDGISRRTCINVFPFTEDRKRETALVEDRGRLLYCVKGAPETLFRMSNLRDEELEFWRAETKKLAREGHKVIACLEKISSTQKSKENLEPQEDFTFLGLLAFEDPPREEVSEAMKYCHKNNVKVLMITGDHLETAVAVAKEVGLSNGKIISISLDDVQNFDEDWAVKNAQMLLHCHVIARCRPKQKLQVVQALKMALQGVIAVTGDGVNDVPALKAADISIAMGKRGTRSAREVSHLILTDDNFSSIVNAISEGRSLFENLKRSFEYLILFHLPFIFSAAIIPLMGHPLLYLPIHVVWLELLIHPTAILAFHDANHDLSHLRPDPMLFSISGLKQMLWVGLWVTGVIYVSYHTASERGGVMWILTTWNILLLALLTRFKSLASKIIGALSLGMFLVIVETPYLAEKAKIQSFVISDQLIPTLLLAAGTLLFWFLRKKT
jgi:Ca2+-transporting ATPase